MNRPPAPEQAPVPDATSGDEHPPMTRREARAAREAQEREAQAGEAQTAPDNPSAAPEPMATQPPASEEPAPPV